MSWSISEFLQQFDLRGQSWCSVELGERDGFSIPANELAYFHAALRGSARLAMPANHVIGLAEGDVAIVLSGEAHAVRASAGSRTQVIEFLRDGAYVDTPAAIALSPDRPVAARLLCGRMRIRWPGGLRPAAIPGVLVVEAGSTMVTVAALEEAMVGAGACAMLTKTASLMVTAAVRRHPECRALMSLSTTDDPIARALHLFDLHTAQPWTVSALARKVGMGRSSFAARFHAAVGRTPMEVLAERRMHLAADLLEQEALKIAEVAKRVGYHSEAAFIRRFVDHFGITPGRMRARLRQPDPAPASGHAASR